MTLRPVADPDFWWHLRTGQLIAQTHSIPHSDPFSFTNNGKLWIAHEWLSEVSLYGLYKVGSYALLIFLFSSIITGAFLLVYFRCVERSRPYVAGFVLLLGAISTAPTWGVRPQMISLLLTSLFLFLLDRYFQKHKLAYIIPLPIITLIWVNLHAGYFLGLAMIGLYIIGGLLEILKNTFLGNKADNSPSFHALLILCGVLFASILAALVNPNGLHIILYPFETLSSPSMQKLIVEWFSPDFHLLEWQPLAWLILLMICVGLVSKKSTSITNILLVLITGYAGLRSMRNVPFFALVAIPVLSEQIDSLFSIGRNDQKNNRLLKWAAPILIVFSVLVTGARFVQVVGQQPSTEAKAYPASAVEWILENKPQTNLYNTYGWGGYLIWKLYPTYRVYIDGRADVYGDAFIFDFTKIQNADPGWQAALAHQDIKTILIEPTVPLANILRFSHQWKIAFEDDMSIIFIHE